MSNDTTDYLIQLVKECETIPNSGAAYGDGVILRYLDQAMKGFIIPAIESTMEEHFVVSVDMQMPTQASYPLNAPPTNVGNTLTIPSESTGMRLRDVYIIASDGTPINLPRLTPTQAASQSYGYNWASQSVANSANSAMVGGFYLQGNQLQIFPYGLASNKLVRMTYQRAPADLCLNSEAGQILTIAGDVITINKVQSQWFSGITRVSFSSKDLPHDYVKDTSIPVTVYTSPAPLNNVLLTNVAGNVLILPPGTGASLSVGDWVCPQGYSVFAQNIPKEMYPALVQKAAAKCIHAAGDSEGQAIAEKQFDSLLKMAMKSIAPRVIGKPIVFMPTNSPFRASKGTIRSNY